MRERPLPRHVSSLRADMYDEAAVPLAGNVTVARLPLQVGQPYTFVDSRGAVYEEGIVEEDHVVIAITGNPAALQALERGVNNIIRRNSVGEIGGWD